MRLKNYLNEQNDEIDDFIPLIKKECKSYLNLLKKNNILPFIRNGGYGDDQGLKSVRKNRTSKATNKKAYKIINKWLKENNHAIRSQSIMARSVSTPLFGMAHYIFPVDKFKFSWVPSKDFNQILNYEKISPKDSDDLLFFLSNNEEPEKGLKVLDKIISTNKGIKEAYNRTYEVWFECEKYYHIEKSIIENDLKDLLNEI